jgi:Mce-associated membrane protein
MAVTHDDTDLPQDDPRSRAAADARARLRPGERNRSAPVTATCHDAPVAADGAPVGAAPSVAPKKRPAPARAAEVVAPESVTVVAAPVQPAATAPDGARQPAATRSSTGHGSRLATVILGALSLVLAVALVLSLLALHHRDQAASARASALAAARSYAVDLSSYNYNDLTRDFDRVLSHATASFKKSYTSSSSGLDTVLRQYKATAVGKVVAAGLASAGATSAVALVFVDQTVTNTTQKKGPTTDESRIEITLVRQGGSWLIDKVQLL